MKYFYILSYFIIILSLSSCVTQRKIEYLQDKEKGLKAFPESNIQDYKLKPFDEIFIQITSLDETANNVFGSSSTNLITMGGMQPYGASLISYSINGEGYLQLPIIGRFNVKDKTIAQVTVTIKDSLSRILNQPNVIIKLVNRYISVLGEVKNPGHYSYSQDRISIYDAIGISGDITDYGNRNQVVLIRNQQGKNLRVTLDLTESNILSSEYYFMRPNDILYVKPLKKKFWGMREFPFSVLLTSITTGILVLSYIKK